MDLLLTLVDHYFAETNNFLPILHRPSFERDVTDGLHLRDNGFGAVVLLVCAIGSRYVDDLRVLLDESSTYSAGWPWYNQVQMVRKSSLVPPRLYDVQQYCVTALFLGGSCPPHVQWNMIGLGVRLCLDVGAHRKMVYKSVDEGQIMEEQWRRAFWVLVQADRSAASEMGRSLAVLDEDIDAPLPRECDDQYWVASDGSGFFQQPPHKPSVVAYFNCFVQLRTIQAFAMRTLFSPTRPRNHDWEQRMVAQIDSLLAKWLATIPSHLRWDPAIQDDIFFRQSAILYNAYHYMQIVVHRPFVCPSRKTSPLGISSVAICIGAARTMSRILEVVQQRVSTPVSHLMLPAYTAAIVLLLARSADETIPPQDMYSVHICMAVNKRCETK
ncbi:hypothetical protein PUNSTDRAFT_102078 [Punctularia strigosozonata HHB-11173 SS5]|uniref:uncharacterized protein n=1 Tax=Punctularia strigosozonata (strain HHB-11173) TaxID=741275 RepID=UPI0004417971|nr:uncharacterized protein PUNSTDRAFT_102078 [Punctularia strigosozonata HHB-11173 SS5]EIN10080.1 hypothetical protein PUNSTDRAFT_102078 [Punctularia strigosozonata HHB-11173 SS5]